VRRFFRRAHRFLRRRYDDSYLFDGDDRLFKEAVSGVQIYGEYGVGKSTIWVSSNTSASILAVDSSREWIEEIKSVTNQSERVQIEWVDLGELGNWGRPLTYKKRDFFYDYVRSIWSRDQAPELVLIDGRFRVSCFLYSLITGKPGTRIFFDDYVSRPHYHVIEEFVSPIETCGRQGLFVIPERLDRENIGKTMERFLYVIA